MNTTEEQTIPESPDYYLGRSCPTEPIAETGTGAKLCELPQASTAAPAVSTPRTLPQTGIDWSVGLAIFGAVLMVAVMFWRDRRY